MGEGDYQVAAHVLDVEWSVVSRQSWDAECGVVAVVVAARGFHPTEVTVENFDTPGLEISGVKSRATPRVCDRTPFVNGLPGTVFHDHRIRWINPGIPPGDRAIFGYEQKDGFGSRSNQKCAGGIKYSSGRSCRPGAVRSSNFDYERLGSSRWNEWNAGSIVDRG
jgi:hypothetical protein